MRRARGVVRKAKLVSCDHIVNVLVLGPLLDRKRLAALAGGFLVLLVPGGVVVECSASVLCLLVFGLSCFVGLSHWFSFRGSDCLETIGTVVLSRRPAVLDFSRFRFGFQPRPRHATISCIICDVIGSVSVQIFGPVRIML